MIKNNLEKSAVKYFLLACLAFATFSCTSTRSLVIDIPQPVSGDLPSSIQSLALVTQAVNSSYTDYPADSIQKIFYQRRFELDTVMYDIQMADTTLKALGELLFESGRYDYVIPQNRFIKSPSSSIMQSELAWPEVEKITETFNTDAVLSLDHLKTRVFTDYSYYLSYDGQSTAVAQMKIAYEALFRVYEPDQKRIIMREFISDTLYWEDSDYSVRNLFSRFTPVKQALAETGIAIALDLSEKIAVRWRPEKRKYFTKGNAALKKANQMAEIGDWQSAIAMWVEIAENTNSKTLKSKAELNIALGFEILGDINSAISWALKSYNTMYHPLTYEYLQILERRKKEIEKYQ